MKIIARNNSPTSIKTIRESNFIIFEPDFKAMAKKNKKNVVYSTNPDFSFENDGDEEMETLSPGEQLLIVLIDRKQRKGKEVTIVADFVGTEEDLKELGKMLKSKCGVGGAVKDGEIIIQGNKRDKVIELLTSSGYKTKRVGG